MIFSTSQYISSGSLSALIRLSCFGYCLRIFSVFSLNVAILVLRVSSLSSSLLTADSAALFMIRATSVSYKKNHFE